MEAPKVFISYSHDSPEHTERVLALSDKLRQDGIDCHIDQYEVSPPEGWPRWMENQIEWADFVLVVCTETYNFRFRGKAPLGQGKGVKWEGAILTQELYETESHNTRFIPVVFSSQDAAYIPIILKGQNYYDMSTDEGYEALYRHLTKQPRVSKPNLGKLKPMSPLKPKQEEPAHGNVYSSETVSLSASTQVNQNKRCFVIMPFGKSGTPEYSRNWKIYDWMIKPVIEACRYTPIRSDELEHLGNITRDIIELLHKSDLVVADLSGYNANVFYELGVRHALYRAGTIPIIREEESLPFDIANYRAIFYSSELDGPERFKGELKGRIKAFEKLQRKRSDNPVHDILGDKLCIPNLSDYISLKEHQKRLKEKEAVYDVFKKKVVKEKQALLKEKDELEKRIKLSAIFEYDVFLSFASADEELVKPIWQEMISSGLRVFWYDETFNQNIGQPFIRPIEHDLIQSKHFVLICTENSMQSEWVKDEYQTFYSQCHIPSKRQRRMVLLKIKDFDFSLLPPLLSNIQLSNSVEHIISTLGGVNIQALKQENKLLKERLKSLNIETERLGGEISLKEALVETALKEKTDLEKRIQELEEENKSLRLKSSKSPAKKPSQTTKIIQPTKTPSSVQLRSEPIYNLSNDEVKKMLKDRDFFSTGKWGPENKQGKGLNHQYEVVEKEGEKLVIDYITGLAWQQSGSSNMNYNNAKEYIKQLNNNRFAGYNDWRLPTLEEAMSLMEPEKKNNNLYISKLFDNNQKYIWTADEESGSSVWVVIFFYGSCNVTHVDDDDFARAVR